jgi:hypothetical protein
MNRFTVRAVDPRRVLVIGIDPEAVAHLGVDVAVVNAALASGQERFAAAGISCDLCLIGLDASAAMQQIDAQLTSTRYECVVIGGGIRKPEPLLEFFERVINLIHRRAPTAAIAFNTNAENSVDAARRWLSSESQHG